MFSSVIIDTTHNNVHFKNLIDWKIPRNGVINKKNPDFLFDQLRIRYCRYEP